MYASVVLMYSLAYQTAYYKNIWNYSLEDRVLKNYCNLRQVGATFFLNQHTKPLLGKTSICVIALLTHNFIDTHCDNFHMWQLAPAILY